MYAIFYQILIFYQMIALQKLWNMFFISSKYLFSCSRYSNFWIFVFPPFSLSAIALEVNDVINCLNKNLITHFVCYLEKEIRCDIELASLINYKLFRYILSDQVRWCNVKQFYCYSQNYICKFMQVNSWHHKLFHLHLSFWIWKVWKRREKITKFEYLENEKSFLDELENIFLSF